MIRILAENSFSWGCGSWYDIILRALHSTGQRGAAANKASLSGCEERKQRSGAAVTRVTLTSSVSPTAAYICY